MAVSQGFSPLARPTLACMRKVFGSSPDQGTASGRTRTATGPSRALPQQNRPRSISGPYRPRNTCGRAEARTSEKQPCPPLTNFHTGMKRRPGPEAQSSLSDSDASRGRGRRCALCRSGCRRAAGPEVSGPGRLSGDAGEATTMPCTWVIRLRGLGLDEGGKLPVHANLNVEYSCAQCRAQNAQCTYARSRDARCWVV